MNDTYLRTNKNLLRIKHLTNKLSMSKSTIWLWIRNNKFPKPTKINGISVWRSETIDQWIDKQTKDENIENGGVK
tara:strand:+ start:4206 stop:4430 length:225 start_codon:yes stop_codon:yes gene_type:complete